MSGIKAEMIITDVIGTYPARAKVFDDFGVDSGGGRESTETKVLRDGVNVQTLRRALNAAVAGA